MELGHFLSYPGDVGGHSHPKLVQVCPGDIEEQMDRRSYRGDGRTVDRVRKSALDDDGRAVYRELGLEL